MRTFISPRTQATIGLSAYDLLTTLLNQSAPSFGTSVKDLMIEPYFDDVENTIVDGDIGFSAYKKNLAEFPYVKFSKQNGNLTFKFVSKLCSGDDFQGQFMLWHPTNPTDELVFPFMKSLADDLVSTLQATRAAFADIDDFDLSAYIGWIESRAEMLPNDNASMQSMLELINETREPHIFHPDLSDIDVMPIETFWQLIGLVDSATLIEGMDQHALDKLKEALALHTVPEIKSFHNHLSNALYALDTAAHYDAADRPGSDGFLYVRCYVVAHGRDYYQKALNEPSNMPGQFDWCEDILYVASQAWATATDDEAANFDDSCTEKSYETGSNPLNREKISEEEEEEEEEAISFEPPARPEIYTRMVANYQNCKSYKDNGKYVADNRPGSVGSFQTYFVRPISYRFRWIEKRMLPTRASAETIVWTDGKDFHIHIQKDKLRKADHLVDMLTKTSAISQGAVHMVLDALLANNMQVSWTRISDIKTLPDELIDDVECARFMGTFLHPDDMQVWVDKGRCVLRRLKRKVVLTQQEADYRNDRRMQEGAIELFANMMRQDGFPESEIQAAVNAQKNAEPVKPSAYCVTYDYTNISFDEEMDLSLFSAP